MSAALYRYRRVAGIDIGVDNLTAIAFTSGHRPVLIKGNEIKAVNQYFNKQIAHYRSLLRTGKKDSKGIHQTKRMKRISEKRNRRVKDILHKASRKIIDLCVEEGIEVIVVGNNAGWKKRIHMGKKNNQTFVQIPFHT
ncbi:MAG: transposase [[Clostridium] innocuum]